MKEQQYCITARKRYDNKTVVVYGPFPTKERAEQVIPSRVMKKTYKYFRVSKYPFREHYKGGYK